MLQMSLCNEDTEGKMERIELAEPVTVVDCGVQDKGSINEKQG